VRLNTAGSRRVPHTSAIRSRPIRRASRGTHVLGDVQISVADFDPLEAFKAPLEALGYVYRADTAERTKRYFREPPGTPRGHIHVRRAGSFSEQFALLFRDYLRATPDVAAEYEALKRSLVPPCRLLRAPPMRRSIQTSQRDLRRRTRAVGGLLVTTPEARHSKTACGSRGGRGAGRAGFDSARAAAL
jgi:GrpB protein